MRTLLVVTSAVVVGVLIVLGAKAQDLDTFTIDRGSRVRWIDSEILELQVERACVLKSRNKAEMRKCNR